MKILILCSLLFPIVSMTKPVDTSDAIIANAPASLFLQGEKLSFGLKEHTGIPLKWRLKNWQGQELRSGDWPENGSKELVLAPLPNGYYLLAVESPEASFNGFRSFAILPDPASHKHVPDNFFSLVTAQSHLGVANRRNTRHPGESFDILNEVLRRGCVDLVRDHFSWRHFEKDQGQFIEDRHKLNANLLQKNNVDICALFTNVVPWSKLNTKFFPDDLVGVYNSTKMTAEKFKGQVKAWEFLNEPDLPYCSDSAWDYAAALKAASLGFKAGDPTIPVANAAFCKEFNTVTDYADAVMLNHVQDYIDIFNIHMYSAICSKDQKVGKIREFQKKYGLEGLPVWVTENGTKIEGSAQLESFMPGIRAHSPDQEMLVAEFLPKDMITLQSLGIDRDFFFVLPPYNENKGNKDWGMMRRDFTVKPAFVAFSSLSTQLGNAKYLGEMKLAKDIVGHLYEHPDGLQTLVYWSRSPVDTTDNGAIFKFNNLLIKSFSIRIPNGKYSGVELFGTPFEAVASNRTLTLTAMRMPAFLNGLSGLHPDVPFQIVPKSRTTTKSKSDLTVIFRADLSQGFILSGSKDSVDIQKDEALPFTLQIFNLSNQPKHGTLAMEGGKFGGVPTEVSLPPFGKVEFNLTYTPELDKKSCGKLQAGGIFNKKPATELVIPIRANSRQLENCQQVAFESMNDPISYKHNSSGKETIEYDPIDQGIKIHTIFPENQGNRWVYPEYTLQLPQESLLGVTGIAFEIKCSDPDQVTMMHVMASCDKGKEGAMIRIKNATTQWEERVAVFPNRLDLGEVKVLRIGLNSKIPDITYWVRNVRLLYSK